MLCKDALGRAPPWQLIRVTPISLDQDPVFASDEGQKLPPPSWTHCRGREWASTCCLLGLVTTGARVFPERQSSTSKWSWQPFLDLTAGLQGPTLEPRTLAYLWTWVGEITCSFSLTSNWNVTFPLIINVGKTQRCVYRTCGWSPVKIGSLHVCHVTIVADILTFCLLTTIPRVHSLQKIFW